MARVEIDHRRQTAQSSQVLALGAELQKRDMRHLGALRLGDLAVDVHEGSDSLWAIVRRPHQGGLALRLAFASGGVDSVRKKRHQAGEALRLTARGALGEHDVVLGTDGLDLHRLRFTVRLTPAAPLVVSYLPRDVYPLDADDNPAGSVGTVEAAQRGLNAGLVYFHIDRPAFGSVLYLQNLTAMNAYYAATGSKPDGAVGGKWPELGYLPLATPQGEAEPTRPLPAGAPVTISDAIVVVRGGTPADERDSARRFIQMLGAAYTALDLPPVAYHEWVERAERTIADLASSPQATFDITATAMRIPIPAASIPTAWCRWR